MATVGARVVLQSQGGICKSTLYRRIRAGIFPRPIPLGHEREYLRTGRKSPTQVGWSVHEVAVYMVGQKELRDGATMDPEARAAAIEQAERDLIRLDLELKEAKRRARAERAALRGKGRV